MHLTRKEAEALLPMLQNVVSAVDDDLHRYILMRLMKKLEQTEATKRPDR